MGKLAAVKSLCWREGKRETPPNKLQRITTKKKTCVHSAEKHPAGNLQRKTSVQPQADKNKPACSVSVGASWSTSR